MIELVTLTDPIWLPLSHRSIGTASAIQDFVNSNASRSASDFAVGDYALPASAHTALQLSSGNPGMQIPFLVGTVSFFVNVPGIGGQVMG